MLFAYIVAIYWVVMLDGIHFSHGEGYCKPNDCDGNAVANTLLEDAYIRCNRCLKPERQKNLLIKEMPKGLLQILWRIPFWTFFFLPYFFPNEQKSEERRLLSRNNCYSANFTY